MGGSTEIHPKPIEFEPHLAEIGRVWPNVGQIRAKFGPMARFRRNLDLRPHSASCSPIATGDGRVAEILLKIDRAGAPQMIAADHGLGRSAQDVRSVWGGFGVYLGLTWSAPGVGLGSVCGRTRVNLGSIWDVCVCVCVASIGNPMLGQSTVDSWSLWGPSGAHAGS